MQVGAVQGVDVGEGEGARGVGAHAVSAQYVLPKHLARGEDSPLSPHDAALHNEQALVHLPAVDDLLALGEGLHVERLRDFLEELGGGLVEERDGVDPLAAQERRHLPAQSGAHLLQQNLVLLHSGVAATVAEKRAQALPQLLVKLVLRHEGVQAVNQLVELVRALVHVAHNRAHRPHDVGEDGGAGKHGHHPEAAFRRGGGCYIPVTDGGHGHQRPIERRHVALADGGLRLAKAVKVLIHPTEGRLLHAHHQVEAAGQPVRERQHHHHKLDEGEHVVVHRHVLLEAREQPPGAQQPHQLHQPQQPHHAHHAELAQGLALQEHGDELERNGGEEVSKEVRGEVAEHDLALVHDPHAGAQVRVVVAEVEVDEEIREKAQVHAPVDHHHRQPRHRVHGGVQECHLKWGYCSRK
mmetsp:Transcript_43746/g.83504  ORF Transcript_43746/g.83504 Transcript_43746/m.83504 type:complete len:411 (-) Transcript_43746:1151-2383(-)